MLSFLSVRQLALQARHVLPCLRAGFAGAAHDATPTGSHEHESSGASHEPNAPPSSDTSTMDPLLGEVLRSGMVAEGAAARLFQGQQCLLRRQRPDVAAFREREQQHLERLQELAPAYRARPSLLTPLVSASFFALGAATAVLPRRVSAAVAGGLQEGLTEVYNDQLRELRQAGLSEEAPAVREAIKALRDEDRSVEGGPQVPDIMTLQRWNEISVEEGIAAAVKFGTTALVNASRRL